MTRTHSSFSIFPTDTLQIKSPLKFWAISINQRHEKDKPPPSSEQRQASSGGHCAICRGWQIVTDDWEGACLPVDVVLRGSIVELCRERSQCGDISGRREDSGALSVVDVGLVSLGRSRLIRRFSVHSWNESRFRSERQRGKKRNEGNIRRGECVFVWSLSFKVNEERWIRSRPLQSPTLLICFLRDSPRGARISKWTISDLRTVLTKPKYRKW